MCQDQILVLTVRTMYRAVGRTAAEREGNNLNGFKDFPTNNGSIHRWELA